MTMCATAPQTSMPRSDVASGQVIADMTARHRAEEFRRFLNIIDGAVPEHLDMHVVLDNSSTHKTP